MVLALINPPSKLTYDAYKALKAAGGALGAVLGAAEAAALGAMAAQTAAALGAGVGGFLIGQAILAGLEQPPILPDMGEYFEAGNPQQLVRLNYDYFIGSDQIFNDATSQLILAPVKGMFFNGTGGNSTWFVRDGNGEAQNIVSSTNVAEGTRFELLGFVNGQNQPITPTKRLPSYVPKNPDRPKPAAPTPITIPGVPPFPITPVVVPNPGNDEPSENEERPPGVVVQIPQTGQQIRYEPTGVTISNYNAPNKEPFRVPGLILPPGGTAATPPCCPAEEPEPGEDKSAEILCRVKKLQDEILDDGVNKTTGSTAIGNSGQYQELDGGFFKVRMIITQRPANAKIQPSAGFNQDVWYAGWYAWLENGFPGDRKPIHFENHNFIAPPEVTGFQYQLNAGYLGRAEYTRQVKRPYVDTCLTP